LGGTAALCGCQTLYSITAQSGAKFFGRSMPTRSGGRFAWQGIFAPNDRRSRLLVLYKFLMNL
jgi:hypothetical protein